METKMRITLALLPLGLLLHCTHADQTSTPSASSSLLVTSSSQNPTTTTKDTTGVSTTLTNIALSETTTKVTTGASTVTHRVNKPTPSPANGVSPPTPGSTSDNARSNNSSGTPTQTTSDSTSITQVSTTTLVGEVPYTTPLSESSSPSQPPSTSSPVGSGSSLATTTTTTQAGMVSTTTAETTTTTTTTTTPSNSFKNHTRKDLEDLCRRLMSQMNDANCTLNVRVNGHTTCDSVVMTGNVENSVVKQHYEEITRKPSDMTLTAILVSCGALLAMIVGLAIYASYHRKSYQKNHRQHLTEELQTVENGYHDNPTLEVMEVQPEMQEKKVALNGEFNDSWIVPIDNLLKEDMPDEEDTHL